MAGLLRASEEGLKIVNLARRNPGWNKADELWCQAALTSKATLKRFWAKKPIRRETFIDICKAVGINNWEDIIERKDIQQTEPLLAAAIADLPVVCEKNTGFPLPENLPPVRNWVNRTKQLETLKTYILNSTITGLSIVGLPGTGKTTLASQIIRQLHTENTPFLAAAWQTLQTGTHQPPPFNRIINSLLFSLSNGEVTTSDIPDNDYYQKTEKLIKIIQKKPCLIVFDSVEILLKTGHPQTAGYFSQTSTEYAWLFKQLLETEHQSKILFTSQESLAELPPIVTREIVLNGLEEEAGVKLLQTFNLTATPEELTQLTQRYQGHPKALQLIAGLIRDDDEYHGNIAKFLQNRDWLLIQEIENFLDQIIHRLSEIELTCLSRISVYQTSEYPLNYTGIIAQMPEISRYELKENILRALKRRQLLYYYPKQESYRLPPLIQEKAYQILSQNPENLRTAHRCAYHYFLNLPLKPETEWQTIEDIKPLIHAHYHAYQAQNCQEAAQIISRIYEYLSSWGYEFDQNWTYLLTKTPQRIARDEQTQQMLCGTPPEL
ncbi:NB-ARC domain-containing protein [Ancylothrix sp. C2]|uniref:NB-ARC domain-containing protein n=1 Tax=Ancylothrix sp. D3o TaxID=2953691 RepID=UPI0021BAB00F|nr:NB-ARC domain-containing protein [Ancylothrix sp. D3o]MCT7952198.1 NB-ARC domain-containing protein [Ancylothrix sp. D3o]